jgi:hypothetical protein
MSYFTAGGSVGAYPHPGAPEQTDLFTVNQNGALCWLNVQGAGTWSSPFPLTKNQFAPAGAFVAVVPDFGGPAPGADVFLVDNTGALQLFTQSAPASSWRNQRLSEPGQFLPGSQTFAVLPGTLPNTELINQISVFIFDQSGTLQWFHRDGNAAWALNTVSLVGETAANANLVGLFRVFGSSQSATDLRLFYVDSTGALNCFTNSSIGWQQSTLPAGPSSLAPFTRLAASVRFGTAISDSSFDDANVFAVDSAGQLLCYALGTAGWQVTSMTSSGRGVAPFAPAGAPLAAGRQYISGVYQTDVFVVGSDSNLYVFTSQSGAAWSDHTQVAAKVANPGSNVAFAQQNPSGPNETDLFLCDLNNTLRVFYVVNAGPWEQVSIPDVLDPGVSFLQGNNQVVYSTGPAAFLSDLQVDILVTEDLVPTLQLDAWGNSVGGLSLQLNLSGDPADAIDLEQYIFELDQYNFVNPPGAASLSADVQCWFFRSGATDNKRIDTDEEMVKQLPIAMSPGIPAGYHLRVELSSTPYGDAINEAKFFVFNPAGKQLKKWDAKLTKMPLLGTKGDVPDTVLTRIVSAQLNIVAIDGGQMTQLQSGAGTITYSSSKTLIPARAHDVTAENSNCIYSTVPTASGTKFVQLFQVSP